MDYSCIVPAAYVIKGTLSGKKAIRDYQFVEMAEIGIEEVRTRDAPVSVSWNVTGKSKDARVDYMSHFEVRACDAAMRNHSVFYKGKHWLRLLGDHASNSSWSGKIVRSRPVHVTDFLRDAVRGSFNNILGFKTIWPATEPEIVATDPHGRFSEIRESGRDRALRSLERLELISVDGIIHVAGDQPVIALANADENGQPFNFPYVTCRRTALLDNPLVRETLYLPLSAGRDILLESLADLSFDIQYPEVMSKENDILVGADYHVSVLAANVKRSRKREYPDLVPYFALTDLDEKADFLQAALERWPHGNGGLNRHRIEEALQLLDQRDISLGFQGGLSGLPRP